MSEGEGILLFSTSTRRIVEVAESVSASPGSPEKLEGSAANSHDFRSVGRLPKRVWKQLALSADAIRKYASTSMTLPADIIVGHEGRASTRRRHRPHFRRSERARRAALKARVLEKGDNRITPAPDKIMRQ